MCKGVGKAGKKRLTHQQYLDCLFQQTETLASFQSFKSVNHNVFTVNISKVALAPSDDKRYWLDSVNSLPHGHYKIAEMQAF